MIREHADSGVGSDRADYAGTSDRRIICPGSVILGIIYIVKANSFLKKSGDEFRPYEKRYLSTFYPPKNRSNTVSSICDIIDVTPTSGNAASPSYSHMCHHTKDAYGNTIMTAMFIEGPNEDIGGDDGISDDPENNNIVLVVAIIIVVAAFGFLNLRRH